MITVAAQSEPVLWYLRALQRRTADLTPAMRAIGMEMESRVSARFEDEADPEGEQWAEWSDSYEAGYPDDGNRRILDCYGDGLDSLTHTATRDSATIGFGQPYMVYHEYGTRTMPARRLLTADPESGRLSDDDQEAIVAILIRHVWDGR